MATPVSEMSETTEPTKNRGYLIYESYEPDPLYEAVVVSGIRLEYLKLAIIVVLIMVIVWYIYSKMKPCDPTANAIVPTEHMNAHVLENANTLHRMRAG
jgi:hypothetical protein